MIIRNTLARASQRQTRVASTKRSRVRTKRVANTRASVVLVSKRNYATHNEVIKNALDYMHETNMGVDIGQDVDTEYESEHGDETPIPGLVESTKVHTDGKRIYSRQEVGKHSTASDCWFIIRAKVYNITEWLNFAPCRGAPTRLLEFAGRDATMAFDSNEHSWRAVTMLEDFHIGWCFEKPRYTIINGPTYATNERRYAYGVASDRWNLDFADEQFKLSETPSDQDTYDPKGSIRDVPDKSKYPQQPKEPSTEETTKKD